MEWEEAKSIISDEILEGTNINTSRSELREVLQINHNCHKYNYNGEKGYLVKISNSEQNNLDIPWSMLEKCFSALKSHKGYNGEFFREHFPKQAKSHGCHVHAIGMIFKRAGIADELKRNYYLKRKINVS